jgi:hypothetical protein
MSIIQVVIDRSSSMVIGGVHDYERDCYGVFLPPRGISFPISPVTSELFLRTDTNTLYYYNGFSWVAITSDMDGYVSGPNSSTDNAIVRWDLNTGTIIKNSNALLNNAGDLTLVGTLNGTQHYADSATNPISPSPNQGDRYYNTALEMEMRYDGTRGKWLSVGYQNFQLGRSNNTPTGGYYRGVDNLVLSSNVGFHAIYDGTVVSFGYTRSDNDSATFEITSNGTTIASVASSSISGRSTSLNANFNQGDILAVRNSSIGNITSAVSAWFGVKWRV